MPNPKKKTKVKEKATDLEVEDNEPRYLVIFNIFILIYSIVKLLHNKYF